MPTKDGELENDAIEVLTIVRLCGAILHGHKSGVQGAALADLLAMWIAGHVSSDPEVRRELLEHHIEYVRQLIPENEKQLLENVRPEGSA